MPLRALEAPARIPEQMPHAVQQVIQECEGPADEQQQARADLRTIARGRGIGFARRRPATPASSSEASRPERQRDTGQSMQDRQGVADLPSIDSQMRRSGRVRAGIIVPRRRMGCACVKNRCSGHAVPNRRSASAPALRVRPPRARGSSRRWRRRRRQGAARGGAGGCSADLRGSSVTGESLPENGGA